MFLLQKYLFTFELLVQRCQRREYDTLRKKSKLNCLFFHVFISGIALLYLQLYRVTKNQSHLQRSLDYVKRILRNLNGRRVTFLCGDAGPLAVGAVVYHKLKNDSESKECVAK